MTDHITIADLEKRVEALEREARQHYHHLPVKPTGSGIVELGPPTSLAVSPDQLAAAHADGTLAPPATVDAVAQTTAPVGGDDAAVDALMTITVTCPNGVKTAAVRSYEDADAILAAIRAGKVPGLCDPRHVSGLYAQAQTEIAGFKAQVADLQKNATEMHRGWEACNKRMQAERDAARQDAEAARRDLADAQETIRNVQAGSVNGLAELAAGLTKARKDAEAARSNADAIIEGLVQDYHAVQRRVAEAQAMIATTVEHEKAARQERDTLAAQVKRCAEVLRRARQDHPDGLSEEDAQAIEADVDKLLAEIEP